MTKRKLVVDPDTGEVLNAIVADDDFSLPGLVLVDDAEGRADIGDTVELAGGKISVRKADKTPEELALYRVQLAERMIAALARAQVEKTSSQ